MTRIGRAVLPTLDLDIAIRWYQETLGFTVLFDNEIFPGFRSVHVGPATTSDAGIWLFPVEAVQQASFPSLVLYSDDIDSDADRLSRRHADIVEPPQGEPGARSLQVRDPSGNILVLAETTE